MSIDTKTEIYVSDKGKVIFCKEDKNGFIELPLEEGTYTKVDSISIIGIKGGAKCQQ
jgi:hypothetical protein